MNITIFGGSEPRPGDQAYTDALHLGQLLAQAGHAVLTGGYIGTMEAVSRGAAQAGGHVIGVTCDQIEAWRPVQPNPWIKEQRRYPTIRQRLFALIEGCDAAIALPGGVGTLAEVAEMWSHLQTGAIAPRPLILVGLGWQSVVQALFQSFDRYIAARHRSLLTFAPTVEDAARRLASPPHG